MDLCFECMNNCVPPLEVNKKTIIYILPKSYILKVLLALFTQM